jgi:hypothetical protein
MAAMLGLDVPAAKAELDHGERTLPTSKAAASDFTSRDLEAAGYRLSIREPEWYEHRLFKEPEADINLHVFSAGCEEVERSLTVPADDGAPLPSWLHLCFTRAREYQIVSGPARIGYAARPGRSPRTPTGSQRTLRSSTFS